MKHPTSSATASPCISICLMDDDSGWCTGCLRTLDEIACWSLLDDAEKRGVWLELGRRRVAWRRLRKAEPGATEAHEGHEGHEGQIGHEGRAA